MLSAILRQLRSAYERGFGVHVYGHERTIHNTGTIDIQINEKGHVVACWFRCLELPYRVSREGTGKTLYVGAEGPLIRAIEVDGWE